MLWNRRHRWRHRWWWSVLRRRRLTLRRRRHGSGSWRCSDWGRTSVFVRIIVLVFLVHLSVTSRGRYRRKWRRSTRGVCRSSNGRLLRWRRRYCTGCRRWKMRHALWYSRRPVWGRLIDHGVVFQTRASCMGFQRIFMRCFRSHVCVIVAFVIGLALISIQLSYW
jgi:hypothetical protein